MAKEENLGVFTKKHPSGMLETDKGYKSFSGNIGDTLIRVGRTTSIIPKGEKAKKAKAKDNDEIIDMADAEVLSEEGGE